MNELRLHFLKLEASDPFHLISIECSITESYYFERLLVMKHLCFYLLAVQLILHFNEYSTHFHFSLDPLILDTVNNLDYQ